MRNGVVHLGVRRFGKLPKQKSGRASRSHCLQGFSSVTTLILLRVIDTAGLVHQDGGKQLHVCTAVWIVPPIHCLLYRYRVPQ